MSFHPRSKPMKNASQKLSRVQENLSRSIDRLTEIQPGRQDGVYRLLEDAANSIQSLRDADVEAFAPLLQQIRESVDRVQLLFNSAATFYAGSVSSNGAQIQGYTFRGEIHRSSDAGHLKMEA